jgi:RecJ-like exonuclease
MEFEFNGGKEISGSGVNYFSVKEADHHNIDLAPLSVVGALGDLQDRNKKHELVSLNKLIVEDGVKTGNLKVDKDLLLFGRETRSIHKALAFTSPPYLPGLSGNEENCLHFLNSVGIPLKEREKWRTVATLTMKEKKQLMSKIVEYLTSKGFQSNRAEELIGSVYTLMQEEKGSFLRDAREYSYVLNACGRLNKSGLGISLCLGSRKETHKEVENLVKEYRVALAKNMEWVSQNPRKIKNLGSLYVVRGEGFIDENLIGAIASIISTSNILSRDKPVIITSKSKDGFIKISARASKNLVGKGIQLGELLSSFSEKFSGLGGGHDVAAGAQIPKENIEIFLKELNTEVSERILR